AQRQHALVEFAPKARQARGNRRDVHAADYPQPGALSPAPPPFVQTQDSERSEESVLVRRLQLRTRTDSPFVGMTAWHCRAIAARRSPIYPRSPTASGTPRTKSARAANVGTVGTGLSGWRP